MSYPWSRWACAAGLLLAPAFGLIAALAVPGLGTSSNDTLTSIRESPERFHLYAVTLLVSSLLLVPAYFALISLLRVHQPRWALVAGGIAQLGVLVALGDAAVELMYWTLGSSRIPVDQLSTVAEDYESGTGWIYGVGGLAFMVGTVALAVGLWRARALPVWVAVGVILSLAANIGGFVSANQPMLISSYLIMLAAYGAAALAVVNNRPSPEVGIASDPSPMLAN